MPQKLTNLLSVIMFDGYVYFGIEKRDFYHSLLSYLTNNSRSNSIVKPDFIRDRRGTFACRILAFYTDGPGWLPRLPMRFKNYGGKRFQGVWFRALSFIPPPQYTLVLTYVYKTNAMIITITMKIITSCKNLFAGKNRDFRLFIKPHTRPHISYTHICI